uniref:Uncharacterized protein n=1 Tax=Romanomermis culicivorax TaxID=13658 RepID=A0A915HYC0_ROMCU
MATSSMEMGVQNPYLIIPCSHHLISDAQIRLIVNFIVNNTPDETAVWTRDFTTATIPGVTPGSRLSRFDRFGSRIIIIDRIAWINMQFSDVFRGKIAVFVHRIDVVDCNSRFGILDVNFFVKINDFTNELFVSTSVKTAKLAYSSRLLGSTTAVPLSRFIFVPSAGNSTLDGCWSCDDVSP